MYHYKINLYSRAVLESGGGGRSPLPAFLVLYYWGCLNIARGTTDPVCWVHKSSKGYIPKFAKKAFFFRKVPLNLILVKNEGYPVDTVHWPLSSSFRLKIIWNLMDLNLYLLCCLGLQFWNYQFNSWVSTRWLSEWHTDTGTHGSDPRDTRAMQHR